MRKGSPDDLTTRERAVLDLIRRGLTNEEIAQRLGITLDGAKYHVSQILSKLGVANREEAAAVALGEQRRWWAAWPLWAKIAGGGTVAAAVVGLAVLAWGVLRTSGDENTLAGETDVGDGELCGEWSTAGSALGSAVTQRYGEIRNCGLFGNSWVITTIGGVDNNGVIGVYRCNGADTSCLDGRNDHPLSGWTFYSPPYAGAMTLLGGWDGNELTVDNAGHQLTFAISTGAFGESTGCGPSLPPAEKAGPLGITMAQGVVCWTDSESEAGYKVEGSVSYVRDCEHLRQLGFANEEIPFSVRLSADSTIFNLPWPQDPSLTLANAVTVSVEALDASGATLLTDRTGRQTDDFCQPSLTP